MRSFAIFACLIVLEGCGLKSAPAGLHPQPSKTAIEDSVAFSKLLEELDKEDPRERPYRIDPRPLPPDPSLISPGILVTRSSDSAAAEVAVFGAMDSAVVRTRRGILRSRGILEADVIRDSRCPGALTPLTKERMAEMERDCPREPSYSFAIALPRPGGPGMNPAADTSGKQLAIRVIKISRWPRGANHASADYVFLREPSGLRFLKRVEIALIE